MKTKTQVENHWRQYCQSLALFYSMNQQEASKLRVELAKEVQWMIATPNPEDHVNARLKKYGMLLDTPSLDMNDFDPWWRFRTEFLSWVLTE